MVKPDQLDSSTSKLRFNLRVCNVSNKIWVMWKRGLPVDVIVNVDQYIHLALMHESWNCVSYCSFIYVKCSSIERRSLWLDLVALSSNLVSKPWLIGGHFNVAASIDEYLGRAPLDLNAISKFVDCISACGLKHIALSGSRYTWTGVHHDS